MEKIASFTVDHLLLEPGVYVSRVDSWQGIDVTTLDLRMVAPNREPPMDTAAVHAIEHLGATFLRNDASWRERIVYFGPMGCRTGFYLVLFGLVPPGEALPLTASLSSSHPSRARSRVPSPRSAATGMTVTLRRPDGGLSAT